MKNFSLNNDLVQMISSGYLKNVKVLEHTEEGRTICEKISGVVVPEQIEKVMKREVEKRTKKVEQKGIDNNGYIKILSVSEDHSEYEFLGKKDTRNNVDVKVKSLTKFRSDNEYCIVFITFYYSQGNEVYTDKRVNCFSRYEYQEVSILNSSYVYVTDVIYPGEIRNCSFPKRTDTYKVWLYGGQSQESVSKKSELTTKQVKKRKSITK